MLSKNSVNRPDIRLVQTVLQSIKLNYEKSHLEEQIKRRNTTIEVSSELFFIFKFSDEEKLFLKPKNLIGKLNSLILNQVYQINEVNLKKDRRKYSISYFNWLMIIF